MSLRPASRIPRRTSRLAHMPRWLRIALTASVFAMFFTSTLVSGIVALPLLAVFPSALGDPKSLSRRLNASMRVFSGYLRDTGLIEYAERAANSLPSGGA